MELVGWCHTEPFRLMPHYSLSSHTAHHAGASNDAALEFTDIQTCHTRAFTHATLELSDRLYLEHAEVGEQRIATANERGTDPNEGGGCRVLIRRWSPVKCTVHSAYWQGRLLVDTLRCSRRGPWPYENS